MAFNLYYTVTSGEVPVTVSLVGSGLPDNVHTSLESGSFLNVPDGTYDLQFVDNEGCIESESVTYPQIITTTTTTTIPSEGCSDSLYYSVTAGLSKTLYDFTINIGTVNTGTVGLSFFAGSVPDRMQVWYDGNLVGDTLFTGREIDNPPYGTYLYTTYSPTLDESGNLIIGAPTGTENVTINASSIRSSGTTIGDIVYFPIEGYPDSTWGNTTFKFDRTDLNSSYITIRTYGHPTNNTGFTLSDFICPDGSLYCDVAYTIDSVSQSTTTSTTTTSLPPLDISGIPETSLMQGLEVIQLFDNDSGSTTYDLYPNMIDGTVTSTSYDLTNNARDFDISTSKIELPDFDYSVPNGEITIFARIYPRDLGGGNEGRIIEFRNGSSAEGLMFHMGGVSSIVGITKDASNTTKSYQIGQDNGVTFNAWNNILLEYDNAAVIKRTNLFVNNFELTYVTDTTTVDTLVTTSSVSTRIGNNSSNGANFNGYIACVYVWNRLLTSAEKIALNGDYDFISYLDSNSTIKQKIGSISDIHNDAANPNALNYVDDFATRMNSVFDPDFITVGGDYQNNQIDHATQVLRLNETLAKIDTFDATDFLAIGNHECDDSTVAELQSLIIRSYYESGKFYGSEAINGLDVIILDQEYNNQVSGYSHFENSGGVYTYSVIPDGSNGSDDEITFLTQSLSDERFPIILVHRDLSDFDMTGNSYWAAVSYGAKVTNASTVRTVLENNNITPIVIEGHTHWFKTKLINGIVYIQVPSPVEYGMRVDSSDKGQWVEITVYGGYVKIENKTDDSVDGVTTARVIYSPVYAIT